MGIIETIIGLTAVSFCVERVVEYVFSITPLKRTDKSLKLKMLASLVVAAPVSYFSNIDVIDMFLGRSGATHPAVTGVLMTAVVLAGGSNLISDLIKRIQTVKSVADSSGLNK